MTTIRIAPRGTSGCCDCSQFSGCDCSTNCSPECRGKSAFAVMCGWREFVDPSVPPAFYRRKDYSGSSTSVHFPGANCTGDPDSSVNCILSGGCHYNKDTCELTTTSKQICNGSQINQDFCNDIGASCGRSAAVSQTSIVAGLIDECCSPNIKSTAESLREDLSDEDLDQDAIDRAKASMDWTDGPCATTTAFKTQRTDDTFGFREVQTRANLTGLTIGQVYEVKWRLSRRILGTGGPFLFFAELSLDVAASDTTMLTDWQDVPNEVGWETKVENCRSRQL